MSDINLDTGVFDTVMLCILLAWPGFVGGAAAGAVIGTLAWTRRPLLGCFLGFIAGALVGWGLGLWGYAAWANAPLSTSVDYGDAIWMAIERSIPGLLAGVAIGASAWSRRRSLGAAIGAVAGGMLSATLWFALAGGS
jgi:hypothetical protein